MIFLIWARLILMMQLTSTFGPLLRIIAQMIGEVTKFLGIWSIILAILSSVGSILFGRMTSYEGFVKTFFHIFATGLGNYDLDEF